MSQSTQRREGARGRREEGAGKRAREVNINTPAGGLNAEAEEPDLHEVGEHCSRQAAWRCNLKGKLKYNDPVLLGVAHPRRSLWGPGDD